MNERTVVKQHYGPVLLLNASYEPLGIVGWQKAMVLVYLEKVEVLEEQDSQVRCVKKKFQVPSVLRLLRRVSVPQKRVAYCRVNVFIRDQYTCQYCGKIYARNKLTLDHVLPVSRGGRSSWTNIVTCCGVCNRRKGDRTPAEARMPLLSAPAEPRWSPSLLQRRHGAPLPPQWEAYVGHYL